VPLPATSRNLPPPVGEPVEVQVLSSA